MSKNILYSFRRCPFAIRTRLSLILSNTSCEIREILLRDKPKEMLKISPKGTVPIFIKDSGEILDESIDIINWLIEEKNFLKKNTSSKLIEDLIIVFDNSFKFHLDRYKYSNRYEDVDTDYHRNECMKILLELENNIHADPWIFGKEISKLDICILPFIRQFRIADEKWCDENIKILKVRKLLSYFINSEIFLLAMKKYPLWNKNSKKTYFPYSPI